jgi:hypothetical protein
MTTPKTPAPVRSSELVRRRVVSVSVCGVENNASTQCNWITTVICDDGALYWIRNNDAEWRELPPIPQPPNAELSDSRPGRSLQ